MKRILFVLALAILIVPMFIAPQQNTVSAQERVCWRLVDWYYESGEVDWTHLEHTFDVWYADGFRWERRLVFEQGHYLWRIEQYALREGCAGDFDFPWDLYPDLCSQMTEYEVLRYTIPIDYYNEDGGVNFEPGHVQWWHVIDTAEGQVTIEVGHDYYAQFCQATWDPYMVIGVHGFNPEGEITYPTGSVVGLSGTTYWNRLDESHNAWLVEGGPGFAMANLWPQPYVRVFVNQTAWFDMPWLGGDVQVYLDHTHADVVYQPYVLRGQPQTWQWFRYDLNFMYGH